jgi:hypothetical protein
MRAKEFLLSSSSLNLFEVKMSPSNLKKLSSEINALVGIEFEMAFPYVEPASDYDGEPDMEMDEQVEDIQDIIRFFRQSDMMGNRDLERLETSILEDLMSEKEDVIAKRWEEQQEEFITKWAPENVYEGDVAEYVGKEEDLFGNITLVKSDWASYIEHMIETENTDYSDAKDAFFEEQRDEDDFDEQALLANIGISYMEDVYRKYDAHWPFYYDNSSAYDDLAYSLRQATGKNVNVHTEYHESYKDDESYTIEPDSSVSGGGAGLEIVSPPMPLDEMIEHISIIKDWAEENDAETNDSTGLHMNVSVPNYRRSQLDLVKLALLLGDNYVLQQFDRQANSYASSVFDKITRGVGEADKALFFKRLKGKLNNVASEILFSGSISRESSINAQSDRVEFRSPGGDWLNKSNEELENTLRRFVVALDAALDPEKYKEEYMKKLAKVFSPTKGSVEQIFIDYTAGNLTKDGLKKELQALKDSKPYEQLREKGIITTGYDSLREGDWIIEQKAKDGPGSSARLFLKNSMEVSEPDEAASAALQVPSHKFDTSRIEDIYVFRYSGNRLSYTILEEGVPYYSSWGVHQYAATELMAIDRIIEHYPMFSLVNLAAKDEMSVGGNSLTLPEALLQKGKPIFLIFEPNFGKIFTVSGDSEEQAKARLVLHSRDARSYRDNLTIFKPSDAKKKDSPTNYVRTFKVFEFKGSFQETVFAYSVQEAIEIAKLTDPDRIDTPNALVAMDTSSFLFDNYTPQQKRKMYEMQNSGIVSNGFTNKFYKELEEPANQNGEDEIEFNVKVKGIISSGINIKARSAQEAINKVREQHHVPSYTELEATPVI